MSTRSTTPTARSISTTTSFRIAQLARAHRKLADTLLGEIGLRVGQEMLLNALWQGESLSQTALAERLGIQPATLTVSLRPLEKAGYVNRVRDVDDQRVIRVSATPKGMALRDDVTTVWRELEKRTVNGLSADEQATFDALLSRITENVSAGSTT